MMRIQPLLKERILRRLTISATLTTAALTTAALGAVAVPAMAATAAPAATATTAQHTGSMSPAAVSTKIYGYSAFCYATGGRIYAVNANNVHIRNAPDGSWRYPIQKNRYWDDAFHLGGRKGFYSCQSKFAPGGQVWIPGYANYKHSETGWIGANYLNTVKGF